MSPKPYGVVYHIFDTATGRCYVGQTVQKLEDRWREHLKWSETSERPLYRAIRKYGVESFVLTKLCECFSQEELNEAELYFGEHFQALVPTGYCLKLGEGKGRHCEATKEKIRQKREAQDARSGKPSPRYGTGKVCEGTCPCGEDFRAYPGRKYCSQDCYAVYDHDRMVARGKKFGERGAKARSKQIKDLTTGKVYQSARAACREIGIPWGSFRKTMLKGERFRYLEKEEKKSS